MWDMSGNKTTGKPIPFSIQATADEIDAMSPAERKEYDDLQRRIVFGHDSKIDQHGEPIEQGIGSASQPSVNHYAALLRFEGKAAYDRATSSYLQLVEKREGKEAAERARVRLGIAS